MAAMAASVSLVLANSFGGRVFKRSKAQMDHVPDRPSAIPPKETSTSEADAALTLLVPTIHCQGCVETIEANLRLEAGVARVEGDVKTKKVEVAYRSSDTSSDQIESAVTRLGHRVDRSEGRSAA